MFIFSVTHDAFSYSTRPPEAPCGMTLRPVISGNHMPRSLLRVRLGTYTLPSFLFLTARTHSDTAKMPFIQSANPSRRPRILVINPNATEVRLPSSSPLWALPTNHDCVTLIKSSHSLQRWPPRCPHHPTTSWISLLLRHPSVRSV